MPRNQQHFNLHTPLSTSDSETGNQNERRTNSPLNLALNLMRLTTLTTIISNLDDLLMNLENGTQNETEIRLHISLLINLIQLTSLHDTIPNLYMSPILSSSTSTASLGFMPSSEAYTPLPFSFYNNFFLEQMQSYSIFRSQNHNNNNTVETKNVPTKNDILLKEIKFPEKLIPEEFLCNISYKTMDEVVYDKRSQTRVNKKDMLIAIKEGKSPYDRQPLTEKDLIADTRLTRKINLFIKQVTLQIQEILSPEQTSEQTEAKQKKIIDNILKQIDSFLQPQAIIKKRTDTGLFFKPTNKYKTQAKEAVLEFLITYGNPYKILGIESNSTPEQIAKIFRKIALALHPDKNSLPLASYFFDVANQAKKILLDNNTRELLDGYIFGGSAQAESVSHLRITY